MPPIIHCVRHAQGYHNLKVANHTLRDPLLTDLGIAQCRDLATRFPYHSNVEAVIASPMKRTIYTALYGFDSDLERAGLRVIALPELQETSDLPCDTGSPLEELTKEFAGKPVDFGSVMEGWNSKTGKFAPKPCAIEARAREARLWLKARPEKEIVVVFHGSFAHYFTEDWSDSGRFHGTGWANTEFRSFAFTRDDPSEAHLIETEESKKRRAPSPAPAALL